MLGISLSLILPNGLKGSKVKNMVEVLQLNLGKNREGHIDLGRIIQKKECNPKIMLLQEINKVTIKNGIFGGEIYKSSKLRNEENCRSAIWISNELTNKHSCLLLEQFSDMDITCVRTGLDGLDGKKIDVVLCSIYMPAKKENTPIHDPITDKLKDLVKFCKTSNLELILGADSNSHNELWGDKNNDKRGHNLIDFIIINDLDIINNSRHHTYEQNQSKTYIDITIMSPLMSNCSTNWKVLGNVKISDHYPIIFELKIKSSPNIMIRIKKKTDWIRYNAIIGSSIKFIEAKAKEITNSEDLDSVAQEFNNLLMNTYEKCCRIKKQTIKNNLIWFTSELEHDRTMLRKKFNKLKNSTPHNNSSKLQDYNSAKNLYRKKCRKQRYKSWKNTTTKLESSKDIARLQKTLENSLKQKVGSMIKPDGLYTDNMDEVVETLMNAHFPDAVKLDNNNYSPVEETKSLKPNHLEEKDINDTIKHEKIKAAINSLGAFKSPGMDGIFPALLQKSCDLIITSMKLMYIASIKMCHIPRSWQGTYVCFLPKPDKPSYEEPKAFRPISLMSFMLKILEKLINNSIWENELKINKLNPNQFAYQSGKSTDTALHSLVAHINKNTLTIKKNSLISLFIDVQGAFDNTAYPVIKKSAEDKNIKTWKINWIGEMLRKRKICSKLTPESSENPIEYNPTRGCPQGGCLSPLLWCLVADSLIEELTVAGFHVSAFADDLVISHDNKETFHNEMINRMNFACDIIDNWCNRNGLSVNPDKSAIMKFSSSRTSKPATGIVLKKKKIKHVIETKYLGVIIDNKLNWNSHISYIKEKAIRALWHTKKMVSSTWGLTPKAMMWIYKQIILPRITYGCIVWWNKLERRKYKSLKSKKKFSDSNEATNRLNSIQRLATMMITGATKSTPTAALNAILSLPPIDLKIKSIAINTCIRLKNCKTWNRISAEKLNHTDIEVITNKLMRGITNDSINQNCWNSEKKFRIIINDKNNWSYSLDIEGNYDCWYTDGSIKNERSAIGFVNIPQGIYRSKRINDEATIINTELCAVIECLKEIINRKTHGKNILILTDNQAVLKLLDNFTITSKNTETCIELLNKLGNENSITVAWSPSKNNIKGNKIADELAKSGLRNNIIETTINDSMKKQENRINNWLTTESKKRWNKDSSLLSKAGIFIKGYEDIYTNKLLNLKRNDLRVISSALSGHDLLNKYLVTIGKKYDSSCRFCGKDNEDITHILLDCEFLDHERDVILNPEKTSALEFKIKNILSFLKKINIYESYFIRQGYPE